MSIICKQCGYENPDGSTICEICAEVLDANSNNPKPIVVEPIMEESVVNPMAKQTEDREYKPLEMIRDNYMKYVVTTDYLLQKRNGIKHINILEFMKEGKKF